MKFRFETVLKIHKEQENLLKKELGVINTHMQNQMDRLRFMEGIAVERKKELNQIMNQDMNIDRMILYDNFFTGVKLEKRRMWVLDEKGVLLFEGKLRQAWSQLNFGSNALLEVIADEKFVSCYHFQSGEVIWKIRVEDEVKKVTVSELGDRLGILGGKNLYYHYLMKKPDLVDDRSSFLEF